MFTKGQLDIIILLSSFVVCYFLIGKYNKIFKIIKAEIKKYKKKSVTYMVTPNDIVNSSKYDHARTAYEWTLPIALGGEYYNKNPIVGVVNIRKFECKLCNQKRVKFLDQNIIKNEKKTNRSMRKEIKSYGIYCAICDLVICDSCLKLKRIYYISKGKQKSLEDIGLYQMTETDVETLMPSNAIKQYDVYAPLCPRCGVQYGVFYMPWLCSFLEKYIDKEKSNKKITKQFKIKKYLSRTELMNRIIKELTKTSPTLNEKQSGCTVHNKEILKKLNLEVLDRTIKEVAIAVQRFAKFQIFQSSTAVMKFILKMLILNYGLHLILAEVNKNKDVKEQLSEARKGIIKYYSKPLLSH